MKVTELQKRVGYPLAVLAVGVMSFIVLTVNKREPEARIQEVRGVLVEFIEAKRSSQPIVVSGNGTVHPRFEASISPQVQGQVAWVADAMVEGGFFREGEPLFKIEANEYEFALAAAESDVALAQKELEVTLANARIAVEEWNTMKELTGAEDGEEGPDTPNSLVLYEPQLKSAKASLAAAKAKLKKARLDLERTTVRAPFNGFVREKRFDEGQYVRVGDTVAELVGTDVVEVIVPLPLDDRAWLLKSNATVEQLPARVTVRVGGDQAGWDATVDRFLGDVDSRGRMNRVVVQVSNPYFLDGDPNRPRPVALAVGMFAGVEIRAGTIEQVFALPRAALRGSDTVWLVSEDERLEIRTVSIARLTKEEIYIENGLREGDRVITTGIPGAVAGMKLRVPKGA